VTGNSQISYGKISITSVDEKNMFTGSQKMYVPPGCHILRVTAREYYANCALTVEADHLYRIDLDYKSDVHRLMLEGLDMPVVNLIIDGNSYTNVADILFAIGIFNNKKKLEEQVTSDRHANGLILSLRKKTKAMSHLNSKIIQDKGGILIEELKLRYLRIMLQQKLYFIVYDNNNSEPMHSFEAEIFEPSCRPVDIDYHSIIRNQRNQY